MAVYIFVKRLIHYMLISQAQGSTRPRARTPEGDEMVQDPECKVYVPISRAIEKRVGGRTLYFCSEGCAKKFIKAAGE